MTQAAKAQEPSMEEILASIRRIIADDEAGKPPEVSAVKEATQPTPFPTPPRDNASTSAPVSAAPASAAPAEPGPASEADIDTMLAEFAGPEGEREGAATDADDVLELTEAMESPPRHAASFRTIEPDADVVFSESPERSRPEATPASQAREEASRLMSQDATAAVTSAFGSLAHTVLMQNARTLDDLVREMLRPMLKTWLDDNLPTIVERLVRAEIERVSRGGG